MKHKSWHTSEQLHSLSFYFFSFSKPQRVLSSLQLIIFLLETHFQLSCLCIYMLSRGPAKIQHGEARQSSLLIQRACKQGNSKVRNPFLFCLPVSSASGFTPYLKDPLEMYIAKLSHLCLLADRPLMNRMVARLACYVGGGWVREEVV